MCVQISLFLFCIYLLFVAGVAILLLRSFCFTLLVYLLCSLLFILKQVISPDEDDGVNISVNPFKTGGPQAGGMSAEDMMIDGPKIPIEELISLVRHSKLATIKEALDYLPNKKFDKTLVQVRFKCSVLWSYLFLHYSHFDVTRLVGVLSSNLFINETCFQITFFSFFHLQQVPFVPDFGTVYINGYDRLPFHMNKIDEYGNTMLGLACQNGNMKLCKFLLSKGANPNHQNKNGQTPAHFAIAYKFFDLSTYIFENGGDDTLENRYGLSPYDGLSNEGADDFDNQFPMIEG